MVPAEWKTGSPRPRTVPRRRYRSHSRFRGAVPALVYRTGRRSSAGPPKVQALPWGGVPTATAIQRTASAPHATRRSRAPSTVAAPRADRAALMGDDGPPVPRSSAEYFRQGTEERHHVTPACRVPHTADTPHLARQLAGSSPDLNAKAFEKQAPAVCLRAARRPGRRHPDGGELGQAVRGLGEQFESELLEAVTQKLSTFSMASVRRGKALLDDDAQTGMERRHHRDRRRVVI